MTQNIPMTNAEKPKILTVMHQEGSTPGRVGLLLEEMGYQLISCKPALGDKLPETLEDYAGAVVFGGPMSANDTDSFIKEEIDWMSVPLRENKPFFGICLGAQMLCKQLGGEVKPHDSQHAEIGYYPIQGTQAGKTMMEWPDHVYQWHTEGFSIPEDATLLASGEEFPNQAFQYGEKAFGVQFHSEVTHYMMNKWTTKAAHRLTLPGAQDREQQFGARPIHDPAVRKWLVEFLDKWVGPAKNHT